MPPGCWRSTSPPRQRSTGPPPPPSTAVRSPALRVSRRRGLRPRASSAFLRLPRPRHQRLDLALQTPLFRSIRPRLIALRLLAFAPTFVPSTDSLPKFVTRISRHRNHFREQPLEVLKVPRVICTRGSTRLVPVWLVLKECTAQAERTDGVHPSARWRWRYAAAPTPGSSCVAAGPPRGSDEPAVRGAVRVVEQERRQRRGRDRGGVGAAVDAVRAGEAGGTGARAANSPRASRTAVLNGTAQGNHIRGFPLQYDIESRAARAPCCAGWRMLWRMRRTSAGRGPRAAAGTGRRVETPRRAGGDVRCAARGRGASAAGMPAADGDSGDRHADGDGARGGRRGCRGDGGQVGPTRRTCCGARSARPPDCGR